jgi:hypothetical protein
MNISSNNHHTDIRHRHSIAIQVDASSSNSDNSNGAAERIQLLCEFKWLIDENNVPELPEIYPRLSYPLIFRGDCIGVDDNNNDRVNVGLIGRRLCDFLQINNVQSVYDNERGRVFCSSPCVTFVVQFWRATKSQYDEAADGTATKASDSCSSSSAEEIIVILEIQRRQGCSYTMHKIRTALKKSVQPFSSVTKPIRYEKLLQKQQSYKPSSHIKIMHQQRLSAPPQDL